MPSLLFNHNHPDFAGMMICERLARVVINYVKSGEFAGRIDMPLSEFDILEREMIYRNHPSFRLQGNAREGTWRLEWAIAGALVEVYPDRALGDGDLRVEVRRDA